MTPLDLLVFRPAPSVSARTKYRCSTRNITTTGTLIMNLAAIRPGKSVVFSEKKRWMPTGRVSLFVLVEEG